MKLERSTKVSLKIIAFLSQAKQPLTAMKLMIALNKKGLQPNKTTVYRILDKLLEQGELAVFYLKNGLRYYELKASAMHHHHHFFCKACEDVFCLDACHMETMNLEKLLPNTGFSIESHDFNVYGFCDGCKEA